MSKEKYKEKIRKLLTLAESVDYNRAEAELALEAARELMAKHHIKEEDVKEKLYEEYKVIEILHVDIIIQVCITFIHRFFNCNSILREYLNVKAIFLLCRKQDFELHKHFFLTMKNVMEKEWNNEKLFHEKNNLELKDNSKTSFIVGMGDGIASVFDKQNQNFKEKGIVFVKDTYLQNLSDKLKIRKEFNKENPDLSENNVETIDSSLYDKGFVKGTQAKLSKGINTFSGENTVDFSIVKTEGSYFDWDTKLAYKIQEVFYSGYLFIYRSYVDGLYSHDYNNSDRFVLSEILQKDLNDLIKNPYKITRANWKNYEYINQGLTDIEYLYFSGNISNDKYLISKAVWEMSALRVSFPDRNEIILDKLEFDYPIETFIFTRRKDG